MLLFFLACTEPKQTTLDAPQIAIQPAEAFAGDTLGVEILQAPSVQEGSPTYEYTWFLNDEEMTTFDAQIPGEEVLGHQEWSVSVIALWSDLESSPAQASLVISNTLPTVSIQASSFRSNEDVVIEVVGEDVDGDQVEFDYRWSHPEKGERTTQVLSLEDTQKGDEWTLYVTGFDGFDYTEEESSTVEIGNAIPEILEASFSGTPKTSEDLFMDVQGFDYDEAVKEANPDAGNMF